MLTEVINHPLQGEDLTIQETTKTAQNNPLHLN